MGELIGTMAAGFFVEMALCAILWGASCKIKK